ncbi:MAG: sigma-70 family RNA polymerase sigma factor [Bacteroidota bacterium]
MQTGTSITDAELFQQIKGGRHDLIDELYRQHRAPFLRYATQQLYANEEDAVDCFQETVIVFYKNVVSGRLTDLSCSIRTYLFAVGKRLVYKRNQDRRREAPTEVDDDRQYAEELDLSIFQRMDDDHLRSQLQTAIGQLGETCRQILMLFYYHRYPIESVQTTLEFSSPGAVRIKKMRCLDQLKQLFTRH